MSCWHFKKWCNLIFENSFRFAAILNGKYRECAYTPSLSHDGQPAPPGDICDDGWTHTDTSLPPEVHTLYLSSLSGLYISWALITVWRCVSTTAVSYSIVSLSWKSSVLCLFFPPYLQPLATTDIFTVSIVLPFPECHIIGSIQCVAFSDLFLSLGTMC